MRKFKTAKTRKQVLAQCKAQGVEVDDRLYRQGSDLSTLRGGGATVIWRSFDGWFFGTTPDGTQFNSNSAEHEGAPWFQALLEFFYEGKP
jgi:hypothetical protein